jgi:beta-lactamase class A
MMYRTLPQKKRKSLGRKAFLLIVLVSAIVGAVWLAVHNRQDQSTNPSTSSSRQTSSQAQEAPKPPLVDLQPTVDAWVAKQSAIYGIVVYDPANHKTIASHNLDRKFFAASLYKLFVAYLALVDFQKGTQDPNETLTAGYTKKQCVDKMIRESNSACGEAMMANMGQETLRRRVSDMGISNTVFAGITTTAQDSALILQYIVEGRDLDASSTAFLKDAMRVQDQRFRNGLAKGAPQATWETKVGWNEQYNYHDVGIMTLPSGRQYVVAILSQNNGSSVPIANFSATIYAELTK